MSKTPKQEAEEYLAKLGEHGHALCPEHKRPYAVAWNSEDAGKVVVCKMCLNRIARQDKLWMEMIK